MLNPITEHVASLKTGGTKAGGNEAGIGGDHKQFYLACGPEDGPVVLLVHGWPELSISWRHQLPMLAALGFRAIAPDMRGYGRTSKYPRHEDYAQDRVVADMVALIDHLGAARVILVGHDWGSPTVWLMAAHHPDRVTAVASLCVPYGAIERGLDGLLDLVDRKTYPEETFPAGQWDYMRFYEERFDKAVADFEADPGRSLKALFRAGNPKYRGAPAVTSVIRRDGGWFAGAGVAPDMPLDTRVLTPADHAAYTAALTAGGFFGPCAYYMNHERNAAYAATAPNGGHLEMPVLFLLGQYDYTCECVDSRLAEPMRGLVADLTEVVVPSGHWMAQERPVEVNRALVSWLARSVPNVWPA